MSRLTLTANARRSLDRANPSEVESAVEMFVELLQDPQPDEITKHTASDFHYQTGVIETANDIWYIAYVIGEQGIVIVRLYRWSELTDDPMQFRVTP